MGKTVTELLKNCNKDTEILNELIIRFKPLIISCSNQSGWKIETEDMQSILTLKLITLARGMKVTENEGQNVKFIAQALRNHHIDMVRSINRKERVEVVSLENATDKGARDEHNIEFEDMIKGLTKRKQEIIRLKFQEMYTDKEIADKLGISRQSVNKQLRATYEILTDIAK